MELFIVLSHICYIISVFSYVTCLIGLRKIENIYNKIHISNITDMIAIPFALLGLLFHFLSQKSYNNALKIMMAIVLWYIIAPITSYIIIKISYFYNKPENEN
jgi:monovalent cation/proton antiporter MnhG/PhaG subunit